MKTILICLLLPILTIRGCFDAGSFNKNAFTYRGQFVYNNQIKMDGMYIEEFESGSYYINYFFQDGTFYHEIVSELGVGCHQISDTAREDFKLWVFFIIEGNMVKIQCILRSSASSYREYQVEERWLKIIDDSTLQLTRKILPNGRIIHYTDDPLLHFHRCDNKPDSLNILMRLL